MKESEVRGPLLTSNVALLENKTNSLEYPIF